MKARPWQFASTATCRGRPDGAATDTDASASAQLGTVYNGVDCTVTTGLNEFDVYDLASVNSVV